jgi:arginyl-tRNA synthetase
MTIESIVNQHIVRAIEVLYGQTPDLALVQLQQTRKEFPGDVTLVVFPFTKLSRKSPEQTANEIGNYLKENVAEIAGFNVVKGFLNIEISQSFWHSYFNSIMANKKFGFKQITENEQGAVMIEYSSPNTNKPLHLGHVRNNLLGFSISRIMQANGNKVIKANLVNDRGIHICKSMLAWQKFGNGATPESTGIKGDHLVGDYYVKFDLEYKKEIKSLISSGMSEDEAKKNAPLMLEAQDMLRKWEANDNEVVELWKTMNGWVYAGFDETYKKLGVDFDKVYYESQTYLLGKSIVQEGLAKGVLYQRPDNSVWIDLTADGLDEKLLLRSDGTSVYMTQDIGTANQRFNEYKLRDLIYVVGNEQNYHFQVLKLVLAKLGYDWAQNITHLSYGMVELPEGKMKSREGTVVDADDLVDEMVTTAREMSEELGKLEGFSKDETEKIYRIIGLGALKYFILKVDPKKNMMFDPKESIDFNGNTGPFVQYTYARTQSILRKAAELGYQVSENCPDIEFIPKELSLLKALYQFPTVVSEAGANCSPALIANYVFDLAKEYNQFYHEHNILREEDADKRLMRLQLSQKVAAVIADAMWMLGIEVPERM